MENIKQDSRFAQLIKALAAGWEIDEPVIEGAMWHTGSEASRGIYHFVLRNKGEDKTSLLSLPASSQLLAYLTEHTVRVTALP